MDSVSRLHRFDSPAELEVGEQITRKVLVDNLENPFNNDLVISPEDT